MKVEWFLNLLRNMVVFRLPVNPPALLDLWQDTPARDSLSFQCGVPDDAETDLKPIIIIIIILSPKKLKSVS